LGQLGLDLYGSGQGEQTGFCACGNETSGFIKFGKFCDELRKYKLLKMDCNLYIPYG